MVCISKIVTAKKYKGDIFDENTDLNIPAEIYKHHPTYNS